MLYRNRQNLNGETNQIDKPSRFIFWFNNYPIQVFFFWVKICKCIHVNCQKKKGVYLAVCFTFLHEKASLVKLSANIIR